MSKTSGEKRVVIRDRDREERRDRDRQTDRVRQREREKERDRRTRTVFGKYRLRGNTLYRWIKRKKERERDI